MEIREFKERTLALLTEPETADLADDVWWERFGDLLDDVLKSKALARQRARDAQRCAATYNPGVWPYTTRCVFKVNHTWAHKDKNGKWEEVTT